MTSRDRRVEALLEKAWRELVRRGLVELAKKLVTRDLITEGRAMIRNGLTNGLTDDEVVARVVSRLL
jgi:hypothetical protein